jgi:heavy metal sensor kinase
VPVGLQLSLIYTLLLGTILALLGWALYAQLDSFLVQNTSERLDQTTRAILEGQSPRRKPIPEVVNHLVQDLSKSDVNVAVRTTEGEIIDSTHYVSFEGEIKIPDLPAGWEEKVKAGEPVRWIVKEPGQDRQLVVLRTVNLSYNGVPWASFLLEQAISLGGVDAVLNQVRLYIVLGIIAGTVVGVIAGLALTRVTLRPLDRMVRTAEAIARGDLDRRMRLPAGRNEVARLGSAFDHMVDRLAATLQAQRRFVADASHELRTPLTSLEGLSEMLLIGADRGDSSATQRMARSIHGELGRMARLVSDLLTLSRLDGAAPTTHVSVDASKLLDEVAAQVTPVAEARQIHLEVAHEGPVVVRGDPDRLKQVVLNLVDNALRYTPPEGRVRLSASHDEAEKLARIEVEDTGQGIPAEDLPHIFDRFYRGDPSRARASGNTGLGLAIVRAIVQAHGGTIDVASTLGEGTRFRVALPADDLVNLAGLPVRPKRNRPALNAPGASKQAEV